MNIKLNNLFDYCLEHIETQNKSIYCVNEFMIRSHPSDLSVFTIAIDTKSKKMYTYSNEWLYLMKNYDYGYSHPDGVYYKRIIRQYKIVINNKKINCCYSNYNVIPFISQQCTGSVHGYAALSCMLNEYINNYSIYKNYKILVYSDSQQGILDIINHFTDKNIINKEQIIYISPNIQYLFNCIRFIPNQWRVYLPNLKIDLFDKYTINKNNYNFLPFENDKVCIIKSSLSQNMCSHGTVNYTIIQNFCDKNNLLFLEPTKMNEIELINRVNDCRIFVTSWGTSFLKNYVYLSNKCEKIIVFVIGPERLVEYNSILNTTHPKDGFVMPKQYKHATIHYYIIDTELNLDLDKELLL